MITFLRSKFLYTTLVDDSYIFFRYADNFVHVNNFIWNIGDKPIEGYTSFLYLLILIAAKFSSLDLELFSVIFGLITSTLTLFFTFKIYNHLNVDLKKENLFTTFLIAISPIFLYWSSAGMETPFYSMFLLLTIYCYLKLPDQSNLIKGLLFGLLCTIRFEATVFFLYSAFMMIRDENSFYKIRFTKSFIYFVLGFAFIFLPYFIWRWNYFGYFLPNTFYSKTGGGLLQVLNGFHYTIISSKSFYGLGWIFLFCILLFSRLSDLTIKIKYLLGIFILSVLSTIFVGGDHFYPGRFIVPVLPLFFSILPPALNRFFSLKLFSKVNNFIKFSFLTIIVLIFMLEKLPYQQSAGGLKNLVGDKKPEVTLYYSAIDGYIPEWQYGWVLMGKTLKKIARSGDRIAAIPIGAIGYYSGIKILDMVGTVDPVIAHTEVSTGFLKEWIPGHNKGDGKYLLSLKPTFIQLTDYLTKMPQRIPDRYSLQFKSRAEIWSSEEFHNDYEFFPVKVEQEWFYNLYRRKSAR